VLQMDPRLKTSAEGLAEQFRLSMKAYRWLQELPKDSPHRDPAATLLDQLQDADTAPSEQLVAAVAELEKRIAGK
jgi:hypothetical protein